jgi:hypothetical protein
MKNDVLFYLYTSLLLEIIKCSKKEIEYEIEKNQVI